MRNEQATMTTPTTTLRHTYAAPPAAIWAAWTTASGIESWWAPDGFTVTVDTLDLCTGGELVYTMTATAPETIAFMESAGMPLATQSRKTFTELTEPTRIAYDSLVDFVPGVDPYEIGTTVEIAATGDGSSTVTMVVESLHDDEWTGRLLAGRRNELANLAAVLA